MQITVVIPSKNGLHHLKECLPTIVAAKKQSRHQISIVIVDDGSTDGTLQQAPVLFPNVTFLANPSQGACSARNYGVSQAPSDWICFLDNDVFVELDFFEKITPYLRDEIFCVTCAGYKAFPTIPGSWEALDGIKLLNWHHGFPRFTNNLFMPAVEPGRAWPSWGVQGACFFCNYKRFMELNGFDEILEPYLLEETDLAYRGLKRGWRIIYAPDVRYRHKCGGTIASKTSARTKFLSRRNRIIFVWKNIRDKRLLFFSLLWSCLKLEIRPLAATWKIRREILQKRQEQAKKEKILDRTLFMQSKEFENVANTRFERKAKDSKTN